MNRCLNDVFGYCGMHQSPPPDLYSRISSDFPGMPNTTRVPDAYCSFHPATCGFYLTLAQSIIEASPKPLK